MVQKMTTLIFRSEILHDEFLNAMHLFCSDVLLFSRKFPKIVRDGDHYQNGGHKCRKYEHKNFAPKIRSKFYCLVILLNEKNQSFKLTLLQPVPVEGVLSLLSVQNCYLLNLSFNSVYRTNNRSKQHQLLTQLLTVSSMFQPLSFYKVQVSL